MMIQKMARSCKEQADEGDGLQSSSWSKSLLRLQALVEAHRPLRRYADFARWKG
jgi:hypothetical protein